MAQGGNRLVGLRIADRYCITGEIGKGGMGVVYKAIPFDDPSLSVAIKVILRQGKLGYDDLMRFQKEASLMSQLHHPNIVAFHELGLLGGGDGEEDSGLGDGYYIVMEIADGTNLKERLSRDGRKDLAFVLQVGLQVSSALDYTHGKNIIHRDIKPHNIIVGQAFQDQRGVTVKVLDFGVARLAEAIREGAKAFDEAAGTPLYMAPEQTPLMDAPVDHRVDLYSLGCVLYELLAGIPPFRASSREKLEKQHVFAEPEPLTNVRPDIPKLVEQIVHKLLAKHPNDRYQTAFSLHADLLRAKTLFEKAGRPQGIAFHLGLRDRFQAVTARLALVGRDQELRTLVDEYDSVARDKGRSRLMHIRGPAGIGKSRLMQEFQAYLARRRVRFVSGQFSQHENALPFNALANAFNEYLYKVAKSSAHEAEEIRRRVRGTLGPEAHRIAEIVPGLKPYLTEVPESDDSDMDRAGLETPDGFAKFARAFSDFTKCLGTDNQPVVFLFHDLHWSDEKSLDLIDTFFANANSLRFYLVVSERTGIQHKNERFNQFIEKFSKLKRRFSQVELGPVDTPSIRTMVSNMLASPESVTDALVEHLAAETRGNPMHIVELTRTLVARDLVHPRADNGQWEFDIKQLRRTHIQLATIDLVLSRIHEYNELDREVLTVAATAGMTFQFENLLLGGRSQSVPVMKSVQRAIEDGLVVRVADDPDLKHLGKTFMFSHKKARDAIYDSIPAERRRELHRVIGERLEAAIAQPSEKTLFALAHHFNSALVAGSTDDETLAGRCLKYNIAAGAAANRSGSYVTSERYYENAWGLMSSWGDRLAKAEDRARVREILADLAALQRNPRKSLVIYNELLGQRLPPDLHAGIAYKAVLLQLSGGVISETLRLIARTLRVVGIEAPALNLWRSLKAAWSLAIDAMPLKDRHKRLFRLLQATAGLNAKDEERRDRRYPAIRMLSAATQACLVDDARRALLYHDAALGEALSGRGSAGMILRTVAERAALLGYLGVTRTAYRLMDQAADLSRSLKLNSLHGYVMLLRILALDYTRGRHEDVSAHLGEVFKHLRPSGDRLAYAEASLFRIFRALIRGRFDEFYADCQRMPDVTQTRSWMSPRWMAMMLYGYLLQGARDNIVNHGQKFLKRRQRVQARSDDLFVRIIQTLIAFARGEIDRTREWYRAAMEDYVSRASRASLYPFEEDFVALFAFTFPVIFEQEYGRHLMRAREMEQVLTQLRIRVARLKGRQRAIPLLLAARSDELAGRDQRVRMLYDQAIKAAREGGETLVHVFGYLWFGIHLFDHGHGQRRDYIKRALELAGRYRLRAIVEYVVKVSEKRDLKLAASPQLSVSGTGGGADGHASLPSRFFIEHLEHVCLALHGESSLDQDLKASFGILAKHYAGSRLWCALIGRDGRPTLMAPDASGLAGQVLEYIEPYVNIRSTLFLPAADAPWARGTPEPAPVSGPGLPPPPPPRASRQEPVLDLTGGVAVSGGGTLPPLPEDLGSTMVMDGGGQTSPPETRGVQTDAGPAATLVGGADTRPNRGGSGQRPAQGGMAMSALVPLRTAQQPLGVLFLENLATQSGRDTTLVHQELNQFGAQLGLLLEHKLATSGAPAGGGPQGAVYTPGSYTLESVAWLKTWHHGRMRAQRETSWFVGLNFGPAQYLMVYCLLSGQESVRERLGMMIWHHVYTVRSLAVASGRNQMDAGELYDEFRGLLGVLPRATQLENIALAFSLINREQQRVRSGHFGPSRPHVIGADNLVTPGNDVVLTYANGRDLRYWDVEAELTSGSVYVSSYDTSRLDSVAPADTLRQREAPTSLAGSHGDADLHRALTLLVPEAALPRYYVGAVLAEPDADKTAEASDPEELAKAQ